MSDPEKAGPPVSVEGVVTKASPHAIEETLERLEDIIRNHGLRLFTHINHSWEAQQVGLKMQEAHVLIFGDPKVGTPLMVASPLIALELPLKVLIWQSDNNHVWVSYPSVSYLTARYAVPQELASNIAGIDNLIDNVVRA
ncbi:DUF302 domain-containing protein [Dictyobacter formicarum]|uniref:DUF302 domain-containing protein n=1 Tax=Dictyobacter formicarum TaxID=2778368 RepID=A0ABQ3VR87_9CHLR|nr:DUF302 domain-containing protein [Dictyobacter formicarum]GHO88675.1 hypothetical protein KSZ_66810 [Dictyobacter formicarum]